MKLLNLSKEYVQDLNYFLEYAESKRGIETDELYPNESIHLNFYFNHSKQELEFFVNDYLEKNEVRNDFDFYYMLNCIIKYMSGESDSHTRIFMKKNVWFPIRFKLLEDGIYIDRCFNEKSLKKKVIKINGIDIDKVLNEIEKCTSYGTRGWLYSCIESFLYNRNNLLSLPSINCDSIENSYEMEDGSLISFNTNDNYEKINLFPKEDNQRCQVYNDIFVFKYPSCKSKFAPIINEIDELIKHNNIKKFVLDLRGNTGGNSNIIKDLIEYLGRSNLELFTIVDRNVFSSGRFAAIEMKGIGSKIVGEEIGTPINCFGYVSGNGLTPNSNINFSFSRVYWYESNNKIQGIFTKNDLSNQNDYFFVPKYLHIDIPIEITSEEYINSNGDLFLKKCIYLIENVRTMKR